MFGSLRLETRPKIYAFEHTSVCTILYVLDACLFR